MLCNCNSRLPTISAVHFRRKLSLRSSLARNISVSTLHSPEPHSIHSFYSNFLKVSAKSGLNYGGKQAHAQLIKLGLYSVLSLQNQVLNFYVKCRIFIDAEKVFDEMPVRNVVTWNTVISGFSDCSYFSFCYFKRMLVNKVNADQLTLNGLLRACIELNDVAIGRQLHCFVQKLGFCYDCFVSSALVDLYGKFGLLEEARSVFEEVLCRDLVLWNVMVSTYAFNCLAENAFEVFSLMKLEGFTGDDFTFCSLLSSCGRGNSRCYYRLGRQFHGIIVKTSFDLDLLVSSALLDMYVKNEAINDARLVFDWMDAKNVVSWNTMIVGYGQYGDGGEALELFKDMIRQRFHPDELTMASVLSSCSNLTTITEILQVHSFVVKNGFQSFLSVASAVINTYAKSGMLNSAFDCFASVIDPDLVTYTSMINAYAFHGLPKESIMFFEKMLSSRVRPDRVAFLGILSACSHGGLISEGLRYFNLMTVDYRIKPDLEHYTCVIDLLSRAGLLDEAFGVLESMPVARSVDALGAFMGACSRYGNERLAKWAFKKLLALEPNESVNYTLVSNLFAARGNWGNVASARGMMRENCGHKVPGFSWMESSGDVHVFASGDKSHSRSCDIYAALGTLVGSMKQESFSVDENAFFRHAFGTWFSQGIAWSWLW